MKCAFTVFRPVSEGIVAAFHHTFTIVYTLYLLYLNLIFKICSTYSFIYFVVNFYCFFVTLSPEKTARTRRATLVKAYRFRVGHEII